MATPAASRPAAHPLASRWFGPEIPNSMEMAVAGSLWIVLLAAISLNGRRPGHGPSQPAAFPLLVATTSAASRNSSAPHRASAIASRATCNAAMETGLHFLCVSAARSSIHPPGRPACGLAGPSSSPSFGKAAPPARTPATCAGIPLPRREMAPKPVMWIVGSMASDEPSGGTGQFENEG